MGVETTKDKLCCHDVVRTDQKITPANAYPASHGTAEGYRRVRTTPRQNSTDGEDNSRKRHDRLVHVSAVLGDGQHSPLQGAPRCCIMPKETRKSQCRHLQTLEFDYVCVSLLFLVEYMILSKT